MRILRIETKNVLSLPDGTIDFPLHAVVVGANDSGKSCLYRTLCCMLGWSTESLAALVRRDDNGQALLDVTPECVVLVEDEGGGCGESPRPPARYRLTRKGTDIKTEVERGGAWVKCQGSAAQALAKIVEPRSAPDTLLAGNLSDAGRIRLVLDVVPPVPYDGDALLARAGITPQPGPPFVVPVGAHVLDFLDAAEHWLSDHRLGVGKAKAAAEGVVAKLAAGLPATTPEDPRAELARVEVEGRELGERVKAAEQERDHAYATAVTAAKTECDSKTRKLTSDFETWVERERAELERRIARARAEMETAVDAAETERDAALEAAATRAASLEASLAGERATLSSLRERHAMLRERAAAWERDAGLREQVEKNRADAEAHAERHRALTRQIQAVRALAAGYVGAALPGVRIQVDEDEEGRVGKPYIQVETKSGWQAWAEANEATRRQVALRWSELRQAQGDGGSGLRVLDAAETLDAAARARLFGSGGQTILFCVGEGPLSVRAAEQP